MKLIMAVSKEGYVSRELNDDMSWTGPSDKNAFRMLTSVGGVLGVGRRTWGLMPKNLAGRHMLKLSRQGANPQTLEWFARKYPSGWLVGGQEVAYAALAMDLVDQAYICQSDRLCFPTRDGIRYRLDAMHFENHDCVDQRWFNIMNVELGDVKVRVWNRNR